MDDPKEKLTALASICHIVTRLKEYATTQSPLLYHLSFSGDFLHNLWEMILECEVPTLFGERKPLIEQLQRGLPLSEEERNHLVPLLSLFSVLFANTLLAVHDDEFYTERRPISSLVPFTRREMKYVCVLMRNVALGLIELAFPDSRPYLGENYREAMTRMDSQYPTQIRDSSEWTDLFEVVVKLLILLHERDARLQFCPSGFWSCHSRITINQKMFRSSRRGQTQMFRNLAELWSMEEFEENQRTVLSPADLRNLTILRQIPFVVPFDTRVQILQELIVGDKKENGREGGDSWGGFHPNSIHVRVRRTHLYEDAIDRLSLENEPTLKRPIRVHMTNWAGLDEAGIDGGGIFREFLTELLKSGFDPSRGLFRATPHDGLLYPNPLALIAYPDDYQRHYYFLGRTLGKLIYENQLAELRFASFFLVKLLGRSAENVDIHHLKSLDPILYKNLLFLKTFDGDVRSLQLDFSVVVDELGDVKKVDLKPNGREIIVDQSNRIEYLHLMADFYLNRQDLYPPINVHLVGERDRLPTAATCMNMLKLPMSTDKNSLKEKLVYAIEAGEGFELS